MRFFDELIGSEGEPCKLADLRNGRVLDGTIKEVLPAEEKVIVEVDGKLFKSGPGFVTIKGEDDD